MQGYEPSTYGDRFADVYDDWYPFDAAAEATVAVIAERARRVAGPILELGIGTGRLALPLARQGFDVRGIDASAAMTARLAAKPGADAIAVTVGDMAAVEVPRRPDEPVAPACSVVFCASNTFFGILEPDAQAACLGRCRAVLAPGGCVIVAAFVPPEVPLADADVTIRSMSVDEVVLSVARRDPVRQRIEGHYISLTDAGTRLRPYAIRYATVAELDDAAADAGLTLVERWADWSGTPFHDEAADHVSVYGVVEA